MSKVRRLAHRKAAVFTQFSPAPVGWFADDWYDCMFRSFLHSMGVDNPYMVELTLRDRYRSYLLSQDNFDF